MTASSRLLVNGDDTIAALATMQGRAATSLIRMSGARALEIAREVTGAALPPPRVAALRTIFGAGPDSAALDKCLLTIFPAPRSYTGEDTAELSVHGGLMVPALALGRLIHAGAREALPGEFTRRALLNGRIDLLQAEAVADLIDARSRGAASAALRQLDGGLTRRILELRSAILEVEALVAYDIDFPEEDDGPVERHRVTDACAQVLAQLSGLLATAGIGELLREGALVVIAGAPNAGKSSLFNALAGRRRSLVTEIPGTTRDAIEAIVDADDWTLRLVDTAGLRDATEVVEKLGIEVAEEYVAQAQVLLVCGDNAADLESGIERARKLSGAPLVAVATKSDIAGAQHAGWAAALAEKYDAAGEPLAGMFEVSAVTGQGLSDLVHGIGAVLGGGQGIMLAGAPMLLRARHQRAVLEAKTEMELFGTAIDDGSLPMTIAGTHLRAAAGALESLIGTVAVDDVLDRVFSSFCVGK